MYQAAELLGLDRGDANELFLDTSETEAVRALEFLADGESIDWDEVRDND